jgi:hypothetical protein
MTTTKEIDMRYASLFSRLRLWWLVGLGIFVSVHPSSAGMCGVMPVIACGQTLQAQLSTSSCLSPFNLYYDVYTFSGIQGGRATVAMSAPSFPPATGIYDPQGNVELYVQSSEVEPDVASATVVLDETSNQWQIFVSSSQPFTTGRYALSLSCFDASATCAGDNHTLCLNQGRFQVQATFDAGGGSTGQASVVPLHDDTGYLWFFSPGNVEVIIKVLNGCGLGGHYWVFAGGLTNVATVITVIDTTNGVMRRYRNPANTTFLPIQDTSAFPTCP